MLIAFTGGPNSGKKTVLAMLSRLGFPTIDEIARVVMKGGLMPWQDPIKFRREVLDLQLMAEDTLPMDGISFVNRGIFDGEAYCYATDCPVPEFLAKLKGPRYFKAFLFKPLQVWDNDGVRYEDLNFTHRITPILEEVYRKHDVDVICVPFMPAADRLVFILEHLGLPSMAPTIASVKATEILTA